MYSLCGIQHKCLPVYWRGCEGKEPGSNGCYYRLPSWHTVCCVCSSRDRKDEVEITPMVRALLPVHLFPWNHPASYPFFRMHHWSPGKKSQESRMQRIELLTDTQHNSSSFSCCSCCTQRLTAMDSMIIHATASLFFPRISVDIIVNVQRLHDAAAPSYFPFVTRCFLLH